MTDIQPGDILDFWFQEIPSERWFSSDPAFDAMVRDPAFLDDARQGHFEVDPSTGEAMQKLVGEVVGMPKTQGERLKRIIE